MNHNQELHDELANDLAGHLKGPVNMVWLNLQLGPTRSVRPDVYRMRKSFVHPDFFAYEVKASRSDFLADIRAEKWAKYLPYCYAIIFAAPANLIHRDEIPKPCGFMQRHENCWRTAKRPEIVKKSLPEDLYLKLIIDGLKLEGIRYRHRLWREGKINESIAKKFGAATARLVSDYLGVKEIIASAKLKHDWIVEGAKYKAEQILNEARKKI